MHKKLLLILAIVFLFISVVTAQNARRMGPEKPSSDQEQDDGLPDEMRSRMTNERLENEHKKVLDDVEKLNGLSDEVAKSFGEHKQVSADDIKKLRAIEKLAKHVLTHSGGEETSDDTVGHLTLPDAIDKLKTAAANIEKDMKTGTRFVVSAVVIANSNEVINLTRFIRRSLKAD